MGAREELQQEFASLTNDADFWQSCAHIGDLLESGPGSALIKKALESLDTLLFQLIDGRLSEETKKSLKPEQRRAATVSTAKAGAFKPKNSKERTEISGALVPKTTEGKDPFSKVLVTVLGTYEKDCAYPANADAHFHPRLFYVGFLQRDPFLNNIAAGNHWKDVGASAQHGEFTHRLQWYVVAASGVIPKNKVGEVYRKVGAFRDQAKDADGFDQRDLWARLCDRPNPLKSKGMKGGTDKLTDFRSPENFNDYLRGPEGAKLCPLLNAFLSARFAKRAGGGEGENFPSEPQMKAYYARKKFKRSYAELEAMQRQDVDEAVGTDRGNILAIQ